MDYKDKDVYDLLSRYFQKELELAKWDGFDSLAHLTYPLRYMVGEQKIPVDMTRFDDVIGEIFETLIKNHKALEINTSGIAMPLGDTLPGKRTYSAFTIWAGSILPLGRTPMCRKSCAAMWTRVWRWPRSAGLTM